MTKQIRYQMFVQAIAVEYDDETKEYSYDFADYDEDELIFEGIDMIDFHNAYSYLKDAAADLQRSFGVKNDN